MGKEPPTGVPTSSAFIDLVGSRYLAQYDVERYKVTRRTFQETIAQYCLLLRDCGRVYFFSDCAFFESADIGRLLQVLTESRKELALKGLYFKGAVAALPLDAHNAWELPLQEDQAAEADRQRVLSGYYFGAHAATLYSMEQSVKGIAVVVANSAAVTPGSPTALVVKSCYVPQEGRAEIKTFDSLGFGGEVSDWQIANGIFEKMTEEFFVAKSGSLRVGRLYVSLLVTWAQSIDFAAVGDRNSPSARLARMLITGEFERLFGDVVGADVLYYVVLSKLHGLQVSAAQRAYENLKAHVRSRTRLLRRAEAMPAEMMPTEIRLEVLRHLSADLLFGAREEARTREALERILPECGSHEEVARQLQEERAWNPLQRSWDGRDAQTCVRRYRVRATLGSRLYSRALESLKALSEADLDHARIARTLNEQGHRTRTRGRWSKVEVARTLEELGGDGRSQVR